MFFKLFLLNKSIPPHLACLSLEAGKWSQWHLDVLSGSQGSKISVSLTNLLGKWWDELGARKPQLGRDPMALELLMSRNCNILNQSFMKGKASSEVEKSKSTLCSHLAYSFSEEPFKGRK